jgi:UDP-N-acetylglucosamine 4,6-dehydratase/5-epimerase
MALLRGERQGDDLSNTNSLLRDFETPLPDLTGASILVTGGTGSFGKELVSRILADFNPGRLIVFSRDELKQYDMEQDYPISKHPCLRYFIGDVRDLSRLEMATRDVDYIVHAAALKQVPTAEYNPFECIHTNVLGAENVVQAAIRNNVKKVIALSTDKAANPINLYGASKLASDKIFIAANHLSSKTGPSFSVVRYGNVVGSRGSVVPLFKRMIVENVKDLPITHPDMTRFWITLRQGASFVLSSLEMMYGGEIFVPKIPSMKVTDLARALAPTLPLRTVGIRPGEKIHEIMINRDDARTTVELEDRYIIEPAFVLWSRRSFAEEGANLVPENFEYESNTNQDWLDVETLIEILEGGASSRLA